VNVRARNVIHCSLVVDGIVRHPIRLVIVTVPCDGPALVVAKSWPAGDGADWLLELRDQRGAVERPVVRNFVHPRPAIFPLTRTFGPSSALSTTNNLRPASTPDIKRATLVAIPGGLCAIWV